MAVFMSFVPISAASCEDSGCNSWNSSGACVWASSWTIISSSVKPPEQKMYLFFKTFVIAVNNLGTRIYTLKWRKYQEKVQWTCTTGVFLISWRLTQWDISHVSIQLAYKVEIVANLSQVVPPPLIQPAILPAQLAVVARSQICRPAMPPIMITT